MDKFTDLLKSFSRLKITLEAYVCLKAITLLHYAQSNQGLHNSFDCVFIHTLFLDIEEMKGAPMHSSYVRKVSLIQDQFVKALQIHMSLCCKFIFDMLVILLIKQEKRVKCFLSCFFHKLYFYTSLIYNNDK